MVKQEGGTAMKWETIKRNIREECKAHNKSSEFIGKFLDYAKRLYDQNLPIISSTEHLALLIGIDYSYVCNMAYAPERFYRHFTIPKKNGTDREIDEPLPDLKHVQKWILENILEKCSVSPYAKAYVKGRTLKHNAKFHRSQKNVVTMDIKDFFPSITVDEVTNIFESLGYFHDISCFLAYLCCLNHSLPQGSPTSPYLSNLRFAKADQQISEYITEEKIRYTRYADDLTFSGDFNPHHLIKTISDIVYDNGFSVNSKKTRVARQNTRQEVTGIVVNSKMQVSKLKRKKIRQQIYYIRKFGLESHLERIQETRCNYLNHLIGQINFALFINPNDIEMKDYFEFLKDLMRKNSYS